MFGFTAHLEFLQAEECLYDPLDPLLLVTGYDADTALNNGVWMDRRSRPGLQRSKALRICSM